MFQLFNIEQYLLKRLERQHVLLMRACLEPEGRWQDSWIEWKSSQRIDSVDAATSRLLPLIYKRLQKGGYKEADIDRLKGAHRYTWVNNAMRINHAERVSALLQNNGLTPVFMKGLPAIMTIYSDPGERFVNDIDIWIKPEDAESALRVLLAHGYTSQCNHSKVRVAFDYSIPLSSPDGVPLDLHWYILPMIREDIVDTQIYSEMINLRLGKVSVACFGSTVQLLIFLVHTALDDVARQVRYTVDVCKILSDPKIIINWELLIRLAEQTRTIMRVKAALSVISRILKIELPDHVRQFINTPYTSSFEVFESILQMRASSSLSRLLNRWCQYKRVQSVTVSHQIDFFGYLAELYGISSRAWVVPNLAYRRLSQLLDR